MGPHKMRKLVYFEYGRACQCAHTHHSNEVSVLPYLPQRYDSESVAQIKKDPELDPEMGFISF